MTLKSKPLLIVVALLILGLIAIFGYRIRNTNAQESPTPEQQNQLLFERVIAWKPGVAGGIPEVPVIANVKAFGAVGDGITDDTAAFLKAISAIKRGAILLPAGEYRLTATLPIRTGIVLRGEGAAKTRLIFDMPDIGVAIRFSPIPEQPLIIPILAGAETGSTQLEIVDVSNLAVGDFVDLTRDNDPTLMYTNPMWNQDWAIDAVGQIVQIKAISGNQIELAEPLRMTHPAQLNPRIRKLNPIFFGGLEDFYIKRVDLNVSDTINFNECIFCWARGIESDYTTQVHFQVYRSYGCEIRDSLFHHSYNYAGGRGYGVTLSHHTTNCLVENNIFHTLRHSMMVKVGAIANVFGYNYSYHPVAADPVPLADVSLHGHYPSYNLFEGNLVSFIFSSDWWGPSGPGNTFFRNQVMSTRVASLAVGDHSHQQNVVGNYVVGSVIDVDSSVLDTLMFGNRIGEDFTAENNPDMDALYESLPDSLYLDGKPAFYGALPFPSIGADEDYGLIPAVLRDIEGRNP